MAVKERTTPVANRVRKTKSQTIPSFSFLGGNVRRLKSMESSAAQTKNDIRLKRREFILERGDAVLDFWAVPVEDSDFIAGWTVLADVTDEAGITYAADL